MNIVIYEDKSEYLKFLEKTVDSLIDRYFQTCNIVLSTTDDKKVFDYITESKEMTIYFLDIVDASGKNKGLYISEYIRKKSAVDPIVFITGHLDRILFSTLHKIMAFNVIYKDSKQIENELFLSIEQVCNSIEENGYLIINTRMGEIFKVEYNAIYYIEAVKERHRVTIYHKYGIYECAGLLKEIIQKLDSRFVRCHKSYVVNLRHMHRHKRKANQIVMDNGAVCPCSPLFFIPEEKNK